VTEKALHRLTQEVLRARAHERETMRDLLSDEFVETGLGPDDEPNQRGLLIEAAIAWLGDK
jgi:hypothetical protein